MKTCKRFMRKRLQVTLAAVFAILVTFSTATSVQASLLAYEGFDYTAGQSLFGQSATSGYGFSTAWIGQSGAVMNNSIVLPGSFTYTDSFGNSIASSGNRVLATGNGTATGDNTGGTTGSANPRRILSSYRGTAAAPATTWFSVIATVTSPAHPYTNSLGNVADHGRAVSALQL